MGHKSEIPIFLQCNREWPNSPESEWCGVVREKASLTDEAKFASMAKHFNFFRLCYFVLTISVSIPIRSVSITVSEFVVNAMFLSQNQNRNTF